MFLLCTSSGASFGYRPMLTNAQQRFFFLFLLLLIFNFILMSSMFWMHALAESACVWAVCFGSPARCAIVSERTVTRVLCCWRTVLLSHPFFLRVFFSSKRVKVLRKKSKCLHVFLPIPIIMLLFASRLVFSVFCVPEMFTSLARTYLLHFSIRGWGESLSCEKNMQSASSKPSSYLIPPPRWSAVTTGQDISKRT
jgi:hypothetical protein